ncbi:MAG: ABC transporter ATP-binding protein [Acidimicrobiia bacterium]|nr:ABC transporter ATP-binding protein [Acidimicrobiia bacterium]
MSDPSGAGELDTLVVEGLARHFGRRRAVSQVSFACRRGSIVGLLGPNGAGKSTLLAMLATLLRPTSGTIRYGSLATIAGGAGRTGATAADLRRRIGMLGHDLFLYPDLTARENLAFFAALYGAGDARRAAHRALERAALADRGDDPVSSFSRGMRQRVALERALIQDPPLLLLDEPFTGLDDRSVAALMRRLSGLREDGRILLVATHDLDLVEGLFDEAVFLRDGRVVELASQPRALRALYQGVMARGRS